MEKKYTEQEIIRALDKAIEEIIDSLVKASALSLIRGNKQENAMLLATMNTTTAKAVKLFCLSELGIENEIFKTEETKSDSDEIKNLLKDLLK